MKIPIKIKDMKKRISLNNKRLKWGTPFAQSFHFPNEI